uniref:Putative alcohol dehydrogenase transcription factor myb/sant-like protein n=1 Tax=Culex tarsalis TaxID=7177 RepID=A0A1Q3F6D7_CULTA
MDSISAETRSEIYEKLWTRMPRGALNPAPMGNFRIDDFIALIKRFPVIYNRADKHNKQEYADTWDQLEAILKTPKKFLMMKWKGLRDNFRVELKKEFYSPPEARYVSKWVHYQKLAFLREQVLPTLDQKLDSDSTQDDLHQFMKFVQNQEEASPKEHSYANSEVKHEREDSAEDSNEPCSETDFNFNHFQEPDTNHLPEITITPKLPLDLQQPINLQSRKRRHSQNAPSTSSSAAPSGVPPTQDDDYHFLMSIHPYLRQLPLQVKLKVRLQMQQVLFNELMKQPIADEED